MSDGWLGFLGGVLTALIGGLIAGVVQRVNEHRKEKNAARLTAYFLLLELSQQYFWVASSELNGSEPPEDMLSACRKTAWLLADKLRSFDDIEHLEETLTILFSSSIPTANERAKRLDDLLESYGRLVNPSYAKAIKKISQDNLIGQMQRGSLKTNAPGAWRYTR
ncbi:hypothetical protein C1886_04640 [Pseudomonas sp. FW300-N1A1]|uniref:hypothetical protein n=1 Tax=Pseudomonas sp. FW300-N1A1 TaxID=2075555 RepID=UPI000CD24B97|nr:hypothetical protein [Pseudomonas sp. FW300-N1A1]POA21565.1 hypothetical protein C1886_04640 [Pseudomonas sp. FW300-N1A1]